jgi:hypothetical protein
MRRSPRPYVLTKESGLAIETGIRGLVVCVEGIAIIMARLTHSLVRRIVLVFTPIRVSMYATIA